MQVLSTSALLYNNKIENDTKTHIKKADEQVTLSKIETIKEQIKNGEYKINFEKTSKAIAENLLF